MVIFHGEVPQAILAGAIQQADALVLYSRYETFGCVLIEANACGVPVIVSDLPVFHETITENINGLFVKGDSPVALANAFEYFYLHKNNFNKNEIAMTAKEKYNYDTVGKEYAAVYSTVISRK